MPNITQTLIAFCEDCLREHGDTPAGVGWFDGEGDARYRAMLDVIRAPGEAVTLLDFGCGTSLLYDYIRRNDLAWIAYSGLDLSPRALEIARQKFPNVSYLDVDVTDASATALPSFDYVVLNGPFTYKGGATQEEMFAHLKVLVRHAFALARKGLAFNVMSKQVDWERDDLFHLPVDTLLDFLSREVSRHVVIRHDYGLYEYTAYVYPEPSVRNLSEVRSLVRSPPPGTTAGEGALNPTVRAGRTVVAGAEPTGQVLLEMGRLVADARSRNEVDPDLLRQLETYRNAPEYCRVYEADSPLVSVCVSTYNREELLTKRCLSSVLAQTYQNFEIVVVGDGCTDGTPEAVAGLGDPRVRFENREARETYPGHPLLRWMVAGSAAANRAASLAQGDILIHLDDDDEFLPFTLEKLVRHFQSTKAEVVWFPYFAQAPNGDWVVWPANEYSMGDLTTGAVAHLAWFKRIPHDSEAYRYLEGGDWNLFRKFRYLGARLSRCPEPLLRHYAELTQAREP